MSDDIIFQINRDPWKVCFVKSNSSLLIDNTNTLRLATTDPLYKTIFISDKIRGDLLNKVLLHELGHAVMFSYGIISEIQKMVKFRYRHIIEEWICNFIADYSPIIFEKYNFILNKIS